MNAGLREGTYQVSRTRVYGRAEYKDDRQSLGSRKSDSHIGASLRAVLAAALVGADLRFQQYGTESQTHSKISSDETTIEA